MKKEKWLKIIDRITEGLFLFIVAVVPVYFAWFKETYSTFYLNKTVVFEIVLFFIISLFLVKLLLGGLVNVYKDKRVFWLLGLMVLTWLVSTAWSVYPGFSFWEIGRAHV